MDQGLRRVFMVAALATAVAGCALMRTAPADDQGAKRAALIGQQAGTLACVVVLTEQPGAKAQLADAVATGQTVLAAPDPTLAALGEAVARLEDPKARLYLTAGLTSVTAVLAGLDVETQTVEAGSPLAVGLAALFDACAVQIGGAV